MKNDITLWILLNAGLLCNNFESFEHLMTLSQSHYGTMKNLDALPWEDALK